MNTWAPLWNKVVDSSLWLEPYPVRVLFMSMMAIKDADDIVRYTALGLARRANMTEAEVIDCLKVLSSPDNRRLEPQEYEGRRIEKVPEGWRVLNGGKYRAMVKREYNAMKQRQHRTKLKSEGLLKPNRLPGETSYVSASESGATDETLDSIVSGSLPEGKV